MRKPYPDDLSDNEWLQVQKILEKTQSSRGRKPKHSKREMINAMLYVLRTGCSWRHLPHDFPPWKSVYTQFRRWLHNDIFRLLNDRLRQLCRIKEGRMSEPSAGVIDSQSIKTTEKGASEVTTVERKLRGENVIYSLILED